MRTLRLAMAQINVTVGDLDGNTAKIVEYIDQARSLSADLVAFPELAITGVLGSNLFNMGFILFIDDVALVGQPLWEAVSSVHTMTAMFAVLMTAVVMIGLITRGRNRPRSFVTFEAAILIGLYILSSVLVFRLA